MAPTADQSSRRAARLMLLSLLRFSTALRLKQGRDAGTGRRYDNIIGADGFPAIGPSPSDEWNANLSA
jgi:hypothetical protein